MAATMASSAEAPRQTRVAKKATAAGRRAFIVRRILIPGETEKGAARGGFPARAVKRSSPVPSPCALHRQYCASLARPAIDASAGLEAPEKQRAVAGEVRRVATVEFATPRTEPSSFELLSDFFRHFEARRSDFLDHGVGGLSHDHAFATDKKNPFETQSIPRDDAATKDQLKLSCGG